MVSRYSQRRQPLSELLMRSQPAGYGGGVQSAFCCGLSATAPVALPTDSLSIWIVLLARVLCCWRRYSTRVLTLVYRNQPHTLIGAIIGLATLMTGTSVVMYQYPSIHFRFPDRFIVGLVFAGV